MTYPVACSKTCLRSSHTASPDGDMLTINRLLMGGTLNREHNIGGRVFFFLTPGIITAREMVSDVEMR